mgnify:CR=1 FL=1|tara:strand:+ start:2423 stop:2818 length:396 start_codon:yes stop_codon:yes gene_type:complete
MIYVTKINNEKVKLEEFKIITLSNHEFTLKIRNKFGIHFLSTTKNGFKLPIFPFSANQIEIGLSSYINIDRINGDRSVDISFENIEFFDSEKDLHFSIEAYNESLVFNGNCDSLTLQPESGNSFYISLIEG